MLQRRTWLKVVTYEGLEAQEASRGVNGSGVSLSISVVAPVNSPSTISSTATMEKGNLTTVNENIQETTTMHKDDLQSKMPDSVAPLNSVTANSSLVGKEGVKTPLKNQEATTKYKEDSHKQTQDSVPPLSSLTANSSLIEKEDVKTPLKNQSCSYGIGKWILDDNQPQCSSFGCKKWLSTMWACRLTQRTDFTYEKLRWQPKNCEMENFTGSKFLRRSQEAQI